MSSQAITGSVRAAGSSLALKMSWFYCICGDGRCPTEEPYPSILWGDWVPPDLAEASFDVLEELDGNI